MSGGRKPMQYHSALYEYMTADDWEHLRQDGAPFLRNCERVFERAYQLGLRRPTEPTLATMAVIQQWAPLVKTLVTYLVKLQIT